MLSCSSQYNSIHAEISKQTNKQLCKPALKKERSILCWRQCSKDNALCKEHQQKRGSLRAHDPQAAGKDFERR
jgi:hypothetical protein